MKFCAYYIHFSLSCLKKSSKGELRKNILSGLKLRKYRLGERPHGIRGVSKFL